jgi:hypothetical protein
MKPREWWIVKRSGGLKVYNTSFSDLGTPKDDQYAHVREVIPGEVSITKNQLIEAIGFAWDQDEENDTIINYDELWSRLALRNTDQGTK